MDDALSSNLYCLITRAGSGGWCSAGDGNDTQSERETRPSENLTLFM